MRIPLFLFCLIGCFGGLPEAWSQKHIKDVVLQAVARHDEAMNIGNPDKIMAHYDPEAVVMPEYHTILYGRERVGAYFGQWFKNTAANRLRRQVVDLQLAGAYALETGNAEQSFVLSGKDTVLYRTKYLRVWNVTDPSSARILAEIWGSVEYLDRSKLPPAHPSARY